MDTLLPLLRGSLPLALALGLVLFGAWLIQDSARMTREAIARRVSMVRGNAPAQTDKPSPNDGFLVQDDGHGGNAHVRRAAIRLFARAGIPAAQAANALTIAQFLFGIVFAVTAYLLAGTSPLFARAPTMAAAACGGAFLSGWFTPQFLIRRQIARRSREVVEGLPDALELLVISVEAGLSFEDGIDRIAHILKTSHPALADELALTSADLKILPNRDQALINFAERIDAPSVRSVVTTLSQTMRYGTPLANALRVVSSGLRNEFLMRLEDRANQLPALMTVPMIIFIMPTIFLVIGGPAVLKVIDSFSR